MKFIPVIFLIFLTGCSSTKKIDGQSINTYCCGVQFTVYPAVGMRIGIFNTIIDFKK